MDSRRFGKTTWRSRSISLLWGAVFLALGGFCLAGAVRRETSYDYQTKSIRDIRAGDLVLAREEYGSRVSLKPVVEKYERVSDHLRVLTIVSADGERQRLKTTNEHPFWAVNRGCWIDAGVFVGVARKHISIKQALGEGKFGC